MRETREVKEVRFVSEHESDCEEEINDLNRRDTLDKAGNWKQRPVKRMGYEGPGR